MDDGFINLPVLKVIKKLLDIKFMIIHRYKCMYIVLHASTITLNAAVRIKSVEFIFYVSDFKIEKKKTEILLIHVYMCNVQLLHIFKYICFSRMQLLLYLRDFLF